MLKGTKRVRWEDGADGAVPSRRPNDPHSPIMAHHSPMELLCDLYWHLQEAMTHLRAYRTTYEDSPMDAPLSEIQKHLRICISYMAFGDLEEEVETNG